MAIPRTPITPQCTRMGPSLHTARLGCAIAKDTQREVPHMATHYTEGIMMTEKQLDRIHRLQSTALDKGDYTTYWSLSLAVSFALGILKSVDIDLERIERHQRSKP